MKVSGTAHATRELPLKDNRLHCAVSMMAVQTAEVVQKSHTKKWTHPGTVEHARINSTWESEAGGHNFKTSVGYIEPFLCRKEREKEMKKEGRREGRGKRREENPHRAVNEPQHLSSVGMDPKSVVII